MKSVVLLMRSLLVLSVPLAAQLCSAETAPGSDMQPIVTAMLPIVLTSITARCRAVLPADAYLTRNGQRLAARLQPMADAALPSAAAALSKVDAAKYPTGTGMEAKRRELAAGFDEEIARISPETCGMLSGLLEPLDPLPPANLATFLTRVGNIAAMLYSSVPKGD